MTSAGKRPLVLLDVDGVLNLGWWTDPGQFGRLRAAGWHAGRVPTGPNARFRIVLNPGWGPMLLKLAEAGAELAWATAWHQEANWHIGPLLGLPELRVAPAVHVRKAYTVIPWTEGRPWAWLEDIPEELETATGMTRRGVPCCPVLVDRETGLTEENAETVARWLESL